MNISDKNSALAQATETIETYIRNEHLVEGDKLPSERKMCTLWGINRSTLRSALDLLEKRYVLHSVPGKGYFIEVKRLVRNLQDLRPLHELAKEQGMELTTSVIQSKFIDSSLEISKDLGINSGDKVFSLIRIRYLNNVPAILEYSEINAKYVKGLDSYDFNIDSLYDILKSKYSLVTRGGEQKLSISYITQNEKALLQLNEGTPVLFTKGYSYFNSHNIPIESFRSIIRTDKIQYMSQLHNEGKINEKVNSDR